MLHTCMGLPYVDFLLPDTVRAEAIVATFNLDSGGSVHRLRFFFLDESVHRWICAQIAIYFFVRKIKKLTGLSFF